MDLTGFVRALRLPAGYDPPRRLSHDDLVARVLSRADLHADVAGINASLELIRQTRGGWPDGPVTEEDDFVDLVWHEHEFRERYSFSYAVYEDDERYVGCCYLYPMGRRTALTPELLHHDVDVSWWVTSEAYARGCYERLHRALKSWVVHDFPFEAPHFSNVEIPG